MMGEDTGEGETSDGPLSLALSHKGRGNLSGSFAREIRAEAFKLGPIPCVAPIVRSTGCSVPLLVLTVHITGSETDPILLRE